MMLTKSDWRLNHCEVDGILTMQHHCILSAMNEAGIEAEKVFEIGTNRGGFTRILRDVFPTASILTIDIKDLVKEKLPSVTYVNGDCFKDQLFLNTFINSSSKKVLFCDGGNKKKEFAFFAQYLNSGDHILLHDYIDTSENFRASFYGKVWNWHESMYEDIMSSCNKYGLIPFKQEIFKNVVWGSFIKI